MLAATVNEQTMVPFVSQQLNNLDLALSLAKRGNLPGAEALVGQNFDRLFNSGSFKEAAEAAAESPQVCLLASTALSAHGQALSLHCKQSQVRQPVAQDPSVCTTASAASVVPNASPFTGSVAEQCCRGPGLGSLALYCTPASLQALKRA